MKIKLDKPIEFTSSVGNRNMSIGNKDLSDGNHQGKATYVKMNDSTGKSNKVDDVDTSSRVDRVESSTKVAKTNTDYSDMVRQRSEKLNQYRKDLINKTSFESTTKSDSKREQNKKELIAKMSSSNDNIKRFQQEFNDSKEQLTNKIHEQNDSTVQAQSKLRESKRQLLAEIQQANDSNSQVKLELQHNQQELVSKTTAESKLSKTDNNSDKKNKEVSIEERKVELVKKVMENTNEDASIKQKLNQYKRELATANAKREQLSNQAQSNEADLQKLSVESDVGTTTELEKIRDIISEQEMAKNFTELIISSLDVADDTDNELEQAEVNLKITKQKARVNSQAITQVQAQEVKKVKSTTSAKSNVTDFTSKVTPTVSQDSYKTPNLTSFDVSLASMNTPSASTPSVSSASTASTTSYTTASVSNISDISAEIASNTASIASTISSTSTNVVTSTETQAIKNKISVDTEAKAEIQQKLREYQAEVRKINSEILELTDGDNDKTTSFASYKNATENDLLDDSTSVLFNNDNCLVDNAISQVETMLEFENDLQEAEIMLSAQEEMNSVIKLLATEIKQDELLAKIAEQEQIIARNKILEKRESLIELAKQNNELLRTLNERLSIITKKVSRNVVYAPTIITQRNRMIA